MSKNYSRAMQALRLLEDRINEALEMYLAVSFMYGDAELANMKVKETLDWLHVKGREIMESLKQQISLANEDARESMADSINSAIESGDIRIDRDYSISENREVLWTWADQVLSSLEWAFSYFHEEIEQKGEGV